MRIGEILFHGGFTEEIPREMSEPNWSTEELQALLAQFAGPGQLTPDKQQTNSLHQQPAENQEESSVGEEMAEVETTDADSIAAALSSSSATDAVDDLSSDCPEYSDADDCTDSPDYALTRFILKHCLGNMFRLSENKLNQRTGIYLRNNFPSAFKGLDSMKLRILKVLEERSNVSGSAAQDKLRFKLKVLLVWAYNNDCILKSPKNDVFAVKWDIVALNKFIDSTFPLATQKTNRSKSIVRSIPINMKRSGSDKNYDSLQTKTRRKVFYWVMDSDLTKREMEAWGPTVMSRAGTLWTL